MSMLPKLFIVIVDTLLYIAVNANKSPVSSKHICQALGLGDRYLETILQLLVKRKLLRSVRGPTGGYILAKERRKIFLSEILRLVRDQDADSLSISVTLSPLLQECESLLLGYLEGKSLEDLCTKLSVETKNVKGDFTI